MRILATVGILAALAVVAVWWPLVAAGLAAALGLAYLVLVWLYFVVAGEHL